MSARLRNPKIFNMQQYHHNSLTATLLIWLGICHVSLCSAHMQDLRALLTNQSNDWASTTTVSFPGSQEFTNATLRWDIYAPPTYSAAISPGTEADVVKSVKLATTHNISILATGRRHGYTTTLEKLQNGLAIDLSKLNSNSHSHFPYILANWVYFGPEDEALKTIDPILALQPTTVSINVVPWNQLANTFFFGTDPTPI
ncbi:hypothetical protein VM1G_09891 [Cytospora mali]|uniref:FAD linked oxidase N-terminal domain-containing protein n=1 Tax=Cytospora mali TaxID=578113 RepID=A0A194WDY4_CYTMA|nr:hypothetical protein VM1G_09891 [Valsa mali]